MPSFVVSSMVTALYEPVRIPADLAGLKGFNVYHATVYLQNSEIPVCIAHRTLRNRCPPGTIARIRGSATVEGRTVLIVASTLIPAAIQAVPGHLPPKYFCLPRVIFDGYVSSKLRTLTTNVECLVFDVTIVRNDCWPGTPTVVSCWMHRDRNRFHVLEEIPENTAVIITGVVCGWAFDDKLMVDVHTIGYNNAGSPPAVTATNVPNPFSRAIFKDGFAVFPVLAYDRSRIRSVLSADALPTQVGMYMAASRDPRRRAGNLSVSPNTEVDVSEGGPRVSLGETVKKSPPGDVDPVTMDDASDFRAGSDLPSVEEVRAASVKRVRARVSRARKSRRLSSPEVPLQQQVKLKISAKQLATLRA